MVFSNDQCAGSFHAFQNAGGVNGLDGEHIHDSHIDAFGGQSFSGVQSLSYQNAAGDDGGILALTDDNGLADFKVRAFLINLRSLLTGEAQILQAFGFCHLLHQIVQHNAVRGFHNGDAGHDAQNTDIFKGHVGAAVTGGSDTGVAADDFHIQLRICGTHENLVIYAAGSKDGEGIEEGEHARSSHTAGHTAAVGFLNAHVDGAVGECLHKGLQAHGTAQVAVNGHQLFVFLCSFDQGLAVNGAHFPCVFFVCCANLYHLKSPPG